MWWLCQLLTPATEAFHFLAFPNSRKPFYLISISTFHPKCTVQEQRHFSCEGWTNLKGGFESIWNCLLLWRHSAYVCMSDDTAETLAASPLPPPHPILPCLPHHPSLHQLKPNKLQKFHIHFRPTPDPIRTHTAKLFGSISRKNISFYSRGKTIFSCKLQWLRVCHCEQWVAHPPMASQKGDFLSDLNSSFWNSISPHLSQPMRAEQGELFNSFKFILGEFETPITK